VEFLRKKKELWKVRGVARVGGKTVMQAILLAVLLPVPSEEEA
jgi:hypothetical protein